VDVARSHCAASRTLDHRAAGDRAQRRFGTVKPPPWTEPPPSGTVGALAPSAPTRDAAHLKGTAGLIRDR